MLIHSAAQLLTLEGGPQRGLNLGRLNIIQDGAILIRDDIIVSTGKTVDLRKAYPDEPEIDAAGCVVMPGFVDPHTHLVWAGDRAAEFEKRLEGKTYLEILASGGGILSTVKATRAATVDELVHQTLPRVKTMLAHGTTTAEAKTGYGLELSSELRLLEALLQLSKQNPVDLAFTFLGAHAIPPEFQGDSDGYTQHLCQVMIPAVKQWWQAHAPDYQLPFVDIFCETGAFSLEQSHQIFETAQALDFPLKIHADEFDNLGGAQLAAEHGAVSADHLVTTSVDDLRYLANSKTVAVSLPCTPFGLAEDQYTPAKQLINYDGLFALASDFNPGTAWCGNMQFVISLACRYLMLTPAQAIAAATINAAAAIQWEDRVGSLEAGKQADILILDIPDYRHLGYRFGTNLVKMVMKKGQIYTAAELLST